MSKKQGIPHACMQNQLETIGKAHSTNGVIESTEAQ